MKILKPWFVMYLLFIISRSRKSSYSHFNMNLIICTNCTYISLYYVAYKLSILEQQEIVSIK